MSIEDQLTPVSADQYGDRYQADYLAMYNDYVASSAAISEKRSKANTFFWTVSTGLLGVTTFFAPEGSDLTFLVAVAGMLLSYGWIRTLESYRTLNAAKFQVINQMEKRLPLAPYGAEWAILSDDTDETDHQSLTTSEKAVPQVFFLLHGIVAVIGFIRWLW